MRVWVNRTFSSVSAAFGRIREGQWPFTAVGEGVKGAPDTTVAHVSPAGAKAAAAPVSRDRIMLEKRGEREASPLINLAKHVVPDRIMLEKRVEREAPQLINLVKHAGVSLSKVGLSAHRAKVALVLDISGSMSPLYTQGVVQRFCDRILALGCKFDDDGEIDVFLFGSNVHQPTPMSLSNAPTYIEDVIARHPLEGDTRYGRAMEAVRNFYFPKGKAEKRKGPVRGAMPVYVMFVTDGSTSDQPRTEKQLRWSSDEPIFWQFMGIGKGRKSKSKRMAALSDSDFPFLEKLDDLGGRLIDNANYFSVTSPDEHGDSELYDLLMTEYPGWLKLAKKHGVLA